ncbi:5-hydroxytryptamine receptor 3A-like [Pluvialis apricaria]
MQRAFIAILTFVLGTAGATPRYVCTYYDVVEYLNISSHSKLHAHILPKTNLKEPLEVTMDFMLVAILSVLQVEKLQTVSFYIVLSLVGPSRAFLSCDIQQDGRCRAWHSFLSCNFFPQEWKNPFATWDPQDFCNISQIVLPMNTYWTPPIFILERVQQQAELYHTCAKFAEGGIDEMDPGQLLGSLSSSTTGSRWVSGVEVTEQAFAQHSKLSPAHLNFVHLLQQISMERRPTLYILNLILPTCALYLLDMAVLFGPSSLEEKISFQIAIILGSSMLAVILNNILPTSSNKPPVIGTHLY